MTAGAVPLEQGKTPGHWRPHLRGDKHEIVLLVANDSTPLELQLVGRVLEEASRRGGPASTPWRWGRLCEPVEVASGQLCVLADDPSRTLCPAIASKLLEQVDAAVFIGNAAMWFAGTAHARGRRLALHWEDVGAADRAGDTVVASPAIIEISGRWTTCAGGFTAVDLALLLLQEFAGTQVALQVMDAMCLDRLRGPDSRQRTATNGVLSTLSPKLAQAVAFRGVPHALASTRAPSPLFFPWCLVCGSSSKACTSTAPVRRRATALLCALAQSPSSTASAPA